MEVEGDEGKEDEPPLEMLLLEGSFNIETGPVEDLLAVPEGLGEDEDAPIDEVEVLWTSAGFESAEEAAAEEELDEDVPA